jgi:hypothetical protein
VKFYPSLQKRASRCYPLFYLEASSWGNKWAPIKTSTHYLSHIQSSSFHCCVFLDLQHLSIWGAETENICKITWHLFTSLPLSLSLFSLSPLHGEPSIRPILNMEQTTLPKDRIETSHPWSFHFLRFETQPWEVQPSSFDMSVHSFSFPPGKNLSRGWQRCWELDNCR